MLIYCSISNIKLYTLLANKQAIHILMKIGTWLRLVMDLYFSTKTLFRGCSKPAYSVLILFLWRVSKVLHTVYRIIDNTW